MEKRNGNDYSKKTLPPAKNKMTNKEIHPSRGHSL